MQEIEFPALDPSPFGALLEPAQADDFNAALRSARDGLHGRTFWHINSTAVGGGVAEMLHSVLCYLRGADLTVRWATIEGDDEFFVITKRIHHFLHGSDGDGGPLGSSEKAAYRATLERDAKHLAGLVNSDDVVVLHDPQTLGLVPYVHDLGASVIWECHVGVDEANEWTRKAWDFLAPDAQAAERVVFSRRGYEWDLLDPAVVTIIPPCIDAFSPKNQPLGSDAVAGILSQADVLPSEIAMPSHFRHQDGRDAVITAKAQMIEDAPLTNDACLVTQISRWDPLKDHRGLMDGFSECVPEALNAHLVLAGPSPQSVTDDPEGEQTLAELRDAWAKLPPMSRQRVHIACLPMDDLEQNAAIVNALQRRSDVIVQKSLVEGFGLTVAEAMWKEVPVVATAVGGIRDQIEHGVSGFLLEDPDDHAGLGRLIVDLLNEPEERSRLGQRGRSSVRDNYLAPCYLSRFLDLALTVSES